MKQSIRRAVTVTGVTLLAMMGTALPAIADDGGFGYTVYGMFRTAAVAVGVVAALVIILFAFRARKWHRLHTEGKQVRLKKTGNILLSLIAVIVAVVLVAVSTLTSQFQNALDLLMTDNLQSEAVPTSEKDWKDLAGRIADEGMTLMRNNDGTLPLQSGTKVNLLGYYAYTPHYSGSGSGSVSAADSIDIVTSLQDAGIEVNPAVMDEDVYDIVSAQDAGVGFNWSDLSIKEVPIGNYVGQASFENLQQYSDTAIVVIGRAGGEQNDLTNYTDGDYLKLSQNEQDLLQQASQTFDTLIVVLNTANAVEAGFLDEYGVDACVWAGLPGPYGFAALGRILTGEVNPSGKLPDTWVYDNDSNPVNENFGDQQASNSPNSHYVDYVENVYVGYRWYETAYAEQAVITNTDTGDTFDYGKDYDSIVAFPFGYGLSYTTFSQRIVGGTSDDATVAPDGSVEIQVEVTNTGNAVGRDVVQLYVTTPYTEYDIEHGVEKPAVVLAGFAKTDDLQPGASQTLTVSAAMEDIASYDASHDNEDGTMGSYMLDAGQYVFSVRSDAHTLYDQVQVSLAEDHFFSGDEKRDSDGQQAYNQFDDAQRGLYLSRADGFANYQQAMESVVDTVESTAFEDDTDAYDSSYDENIPDLVKGKDYAADGDLTLDDMRGLDYDDEQWTALISQLTVDELVSLVGHSTYASPALPSIGKDRRTMDSDGPLGLSSMFNTSVNGVAYTCVPLLAATFNVDLAREWGSQMADQAKHNGVSGLYAPAMNIHRSAYSGRNYEYYSEDPTLSGVIAAHQVSGARENGLAVYIKHFALNDQESQRSGNLHTYSNEQAIREIYLKPFEMAVKDGGATGVMTSMNFIGDVYAGADEGLLTEVLRNEWGFRGKVVTDMDDGNVKACADAAMRAGLDAWLSISTVNIKSDSDADIYYLQRAAHNSLYTLANGTLFGLDIMGWRTFVTCIKVELAIIIVLCIAAIVLRTLKPKPVVIEDRQDVALASDK